MANRTVFQGRQTPRNNFSLVELLVVMAIIAILTCMLLPALKKAKDAGKYSICQNNLKQIGMAFQLYIDDYNEHYPLYSHGAYGWTKRLVMVGRYIPGKVFVCPKRNSTFAEMYKWQNALSYPVNNFWDYPDYGYNYLNFGLKLGSPVDWSWSAKLSQVRRPSTTLVVAESARGDYTNRSIGSSYIEPYVNAASSGSISWPTHDGTCLILWADGHVKGERGGGHAGEAAAANLKPLLANCWKLD